ncbi:hypothetical protein IFT69_18545 [Pseudomonas putida]|nr:hypothetical protein [Pseudomonas putida]
MNTLIIPFSASSVSLRSTPHVVGVPSATAIAGFGHALCRLIGEAFGLEIHERGTALAVNRYSLLPGRPKHALARKTQGSKARDGSGSPMVDERIGHLTGAILVRFEASSIGTQTVASALDGLKDLMHLLRLAGGHLQVTHKLSLFQDDDGPAALRTLPGYYRILVDRTSWIASYAKLKEIDHLESLVKLLLASERQMSSFSHDALSSPDVSVSPEVEAEPPLEGFEEFYIEADAQESTLDPDKVYLGRLLPIDIGYRLIEKPTSRNTGMPYLHAYAEPVLGIARLQALSSYRKSKEGFSAFWVHHNEANTYLALGAN